MHAILGALNLLQCNVSETANLGEAREVIKDYIEKHPENEVIHASGWKHNWPELINSNAKIMRDSDSVGAATAKMIDDIIPDRPFLVRI